MVATKTVGATAVAAAAEGTAGMVVMAALVGMVAAVMVVVAASMVAGAAAGVVAAVVTLVVVAAVAAAAVTPLATAAKMFTRRGRRCYREFRETRRTPPGYRPSVKRSLVPHQPTPSSKGHATEVNIRRGRRGLT